MCMRVQSSDASSGSVQCQTRRKKLLMITADDEMSKDDGKQPSI